MPALRELQCAIGRAVLGKDEASLVDVILGDGLDPAQRVGIYRNHYLISLTEALKEIYPVVCRLVDERFFGFAAFAFIEQAPPRQPCLFEYGEGFAAFLAGFGPCQSLPYLPDVARFEWAIHAALHVPAEKPVDKAAFAQIPAADFARLIFRFQPSLGLVASDWPVDRIWQANRPEKLEADGVDLDQGGCRLEIRQRGDSVVFRRLEAEDFDFRKALNEGWPLEAVAASILERNRLFDLTMALRRLLGEGLVTGSRLAPPETQA